MSITITRTIAGLEYEATLDGDHVTISVEGVWATEGIRLDSGRIDEAPADLGEEVYGALEDALTEAIETIAEWNLAVEALRGGQP